MIRLLWTRSGLPASRLIRALSGEDVSHFAIEIDNRYVFHSNFYGAHLKWRSTFVKQSEIIHQLELKLTPAQEELIYLELINRFDEQTYDWGAFFYLSWRMLLYRFAGGELPKTNPWSSNRGLLCTELAQCLMVVGAKLPTLDTILPGRLYSILKDQSYDVPEPRN